MSGEKNLCIICAYRGTCNKQFSLPAGRKCPDFEKDLSLKEQPTPTTTESQKS
ncbi:MAG: hypothetical protein HQL10_08040 [Nitrospirae bacterium]|nr:hypothetical protein [Nitrospirota bacterium]